MTHTEIIAVKLFGWEACETPPIETDPNVRWYQKMGSREHLEYVGYRSDDADICGTIYRTVGWPNFADERLKWYSIRQMEDALAKRWLLKQYMLTIDGEFTVKASDPMPGTCITWQSFAMLRATAAQRVEAAVKVLEGQG